MNRISISQAWSYATSFFSGQGANHAIALIGVGIVIPLILQFALGGGAAMTDPMAFAAAGGGAAMGGMMILLSLINYVLQTGSYFASWRIGLTNGAEPVGQALVYGFIASLPVLALSIVLLIVLVILMMLIFGSAIMAGFTGATPDPAALASRGALALVMIPLLFLFFVWLAARFCCSGPIMADQRSYNIISALGESWRMTAVSQWKIFGYFILLGIALFVILMILGAIVGVSMFAGGGMPSTGSFIGIMVGALLLSIPMAYLQVGIPVGIYRALGPTKASDVFA